MDITIDTVRIPNAPVEKLSAYFARPAAEGRYPGVVIIHEAFGLTENIKDIARRFANEGYAALAVDLFAGRNQVVCMFRFFGGMFLSSMDNEAIRSLKASLSYLEQHPNVDASKLGAIGFCMGGGFAIAWACTDSRLNVIAPFYGVNPRPLAAVARSCPVVASYPEQDFTAGMGLKLAAELDRHNVTHDVKVYPGAKHSFFNDERPANYDAAASADAWQRTLAFFEQHIGG
ncbi:MAG: dienelactone hydrolase family protein [Anaerolineae bacterium]|nr:dienelactone hydrolase family protein [Anaerolineae bacterium]